MNRSLRTLVFFCITAFFVALGLGAKTESPPSGEAEAAWMTDYDAARAKAKAEDKPLLLNFTGSDWCGWCIRLDREVFDHAPFAEYAESALVLVKLDFPQGKPQPREVRAQNEALMRKFGVRGFPTILLLSPEGELLAETGYQPGGVEAYVEHLKAILAEAESDA